MSLLLTKQRNQCCVKIAKRFSGGDCGSGSAGSKKGLVLGIYDGCNPLEYKLTAAGQRFDDTIGGKIRNLITGTDIRKGTAQVFANLHYDFPSIAIAHLGPEGAGYNDLEKLDECKENIRTAAGIGTKYLQDVGMTQLYIEGFTNTEAAAEGAYLATWKYIDQKTGGSVLTDVSVNLYDNDDHEGWNRGKTKAQSQNFARRIEDTPANLMTPTIFAGHAIDNLCSCGVQVEVRDRDWIETNNMHAFLTVSKGSCEPPIMLEIGYCGGDMKAKPLILVGKGITFDSGGLCLKDCPGMSQYRGDLAGAAVVLGVMKCIALMSLPINVMALVPLCENMIGGMATKPGDIVMSKMGKSVRIEDTDNEGRVILADALSYGSWMKPCLLFNVATLTPGTRKNLGTSASGCFTNSDVVWRELERAGAETGDRLWRMPLWHFYQERVTDYVGVDVNNVGTGKGGGACLGAAFLKEFVDERLDFVHLDITGTGMLSTGFSFPYLRKGFMTGRPVRTIVQFLYQIACPHDKGEDC